MRKMAVAAAEMWAWRVNHAAEELHVAAFLDACFLMLHLPVVLMKTSSTSIGM